MAEAVRQEETAETRRVAKKAALFQQTTGEVVASAANASVSARGFAQPFADSGVQQVTRQRADTERVATVFVLGPQGLPSIGGLADGFSKIAQRWLISKAEQARLLGFEHDTSMLDLILSGRVKPFTRDLKARMAYLIGISVGLGDLLNDSESVEREWLLKARASFANYSALEYMVEGSFERILQVYHYLQEARGLDR